MTSSVSPYSFFTKWADTGLVEDPMLSEKTILAPLRNALFKNEPLIKEIGTINKTKHVILTIIFVIAFTLSPFINCGQHIVSSVQLAFNAPFNRAAYPAIKNDHWVAIILSGVICFPLTPFLGILSSVGSVFKTIEYQNAVAN